MAIPGPNRIELQTVYADYLSVGSLFTTSHAPFLFKTEVVYNLDRPLQARQRDIPTGAIRHNEVEVAIGTDINLGNYGNVTLECLARVTSENDERLAINRTAVFSAVAWSNNFRNDKL